MPDPFVSIVLPGAPRGKGRPRISSIGGFARAFTDKETRKYEDALKVAGIAAMAGRPYLDEAVSVMILAHMPVPASWSNKKRAQALAGEIQHTSAPDWDNISKMIDGLNYHPPRFKGDKEKRPIIWRSDAQIVSAQVRKMYSDRPRLEIYVFRWAD